jgi:hypothetical protein
MDAIEDSIQPTHVNMFCTDNGILVWNINLEFRELIHLRKPINQSINKSDVDWMVVDSEAEKMKMK